MNEKDAEMLERLVTRYGINVVLTHVISGFSSWIGDERLRHIPEALSLALKLIQMGRRGEKRKVLLIEEV